MAVGFPGARGAGVGLGVGLGVVGCAVGVRDGCPVVGVADVGKDVGKDVGRDTYWLGCSSLSKLHGSQKHEPCMGQPHCAWLWSGQGPSAAVRSEALAFSPEQSTAGSRRQLFEAARTAARWRRGDLRVTRPSGSSSRAPLGRDTEEPP